MITFFILAFIAGCFWGILELIYEGTAKQIRSLPIDTQHIFYNSYEENQKILDSIQNRKTFQSLISTVVSAVVIALLYWIYLSD